MERENEEIKKIYLNLMRNKNNTLDDKKEIKIIRAKMTATMKAMKDMQTRMQKLDK
ncbi:hypothetical protein S100390_v1c03910 [Spiroplasma sp. NBRC 100390]|uniref:hypothetical protein n=1 Tax=unclassified Spiroplasma TaxID=2637901 RepID=UPI000892A22B|nr:MULTISPECIES: hypothetical protein [unclassified Spiroplasma]AOX43734.1 hypothetical protein STU14_v1c03910 [Spiroplasma sp. TU-14]APE13204.1 hypothetical protein S100390_v1c03910 [Spiroplasma sp. NBRC 100390]